MNVYIAGVYNNPKNSSYTKHKKCNVIDALRDQLSEFSPNDMVFVGGDLVLTSETSLTKSTIVQYLSVQNLNFLSDHRPILLKITRN